MSEISPDTQPIRPKKQNRWSGFLISLVIVLAVIGIGAYGGYQSGLGVRIAAERTQVAQTLGEQLTLAQQDMAASRYDIARQRLEYIIRNDPGFPGAAQMLSEAILQLSITPSPTPTLVPTATPTPDLRAQDAIFGEAQQKLASRDWSGAIGALDGLRKKDPIYRTAQVDSMYYAALRNRGVDAILGQGQFAETTNLEGGIYDLTLAERFGPLDGNSAGLRNFARMYIQGASYWEIDWLQVMNYFDQVYRFAPNLRDSTNMTATTRYRTALLRYGDALVAAGGRPKDYCQALDYWGRANAMSPLDNDYQFKFTKLNLDCNPPTPTVDPSILPTPGP